MTRSFLTLLVCAGTLAFAQDPNLVAEHAALTSDCKAVRGHAQGIVTEASQSELNKDVTLAQAQEVVKALRSMEGRLASTKKMLTSSQLKTVATHYATLEALCTELQKQTGAIVSELQKSEPDKIKVRNMAVDLRTKMKNGAAEHDQMKAKLGIK